MISDKYLDNGHLVKCFLFLLTTAVYFPVLLNPFTIGDDQWMLLENSYVKEISFGTIRQYFSLFKNGQYSPLNTLFYSIIYKIRGFDPVCFHMLSMVGHGINSILVYTFVRKLFSAYPHCQYLSLFVATLFCVHPIQAEAIAWVSASKVIFFSTFYLFSLCMYINYINKPGIFRYLIVFILFVLSVFVKEQAVLLPFSLLLIDYLLLKKWNRRILIDKIPFLLLAFIYGIIVVNENNALNENKFFSNYYSLSQTFILACWCFITYLILLFLPFRFMASEIFPVNTGLYWLSQYLIFVLLTLMVIAFLIIAIRDGKKVAAFGIAFWCLNILLVLNLIPMSRPAIIANRYIYISNIGIFIYIINLLEKSKQRVILRYVAIIFITGMSYISHQEILKWGKTNILKEKK